jgi:7-carboxy-7-deazaguanine synthase (Cx14CxxC type)
MSKPYRVKEIFPTLQGEAFHAGRAAVFCRFSGCNLWSGREEDREKALCDFCDTDFVGTDGPGGGEFDEPAVLATAIESCWTEKWSDASGRFVVFTGGEPLLQLDTRLIDELKRKHFEIAVETNGTIEAPDGIDWLTVSPKPNSKLIQKNGSELKLVFPQEVTPESVEDLDFEYFYLSPMDSFDPIQNQQNLQKALEYCTSNPKWRLTMQHHKIWNIR